MMIRTEGRMKELIDTARPHLREELDAALSEVYKLLSNLVGTPLKAPLITLTLEPIERLQEEISHDPL